MLPRIEEYIKQHQHHLCEKLSLMNQAIVYHEVKESCCYLQQNSLNRSRWLVHSTVGDAVLLRGSEYCHKCGEKLVAVEKAK